MTNPPATHRQMTRQETTLIWLLLAAAFVAVLNETTMGVALPDIMEDFKINALQAQWLTTGFMLTMAVVIPTTGFLLQRFTTRAVFFAATSLFSAGTVIATIAPSFEALLAARVIQASGTAIMFPLLMTTVMNLVPAESRGRFMGRISIVMSLAPAIGPVMAGAVLDVLTWHWIFAIVLPVSIGALIAGAVWMRSTGEISKAPLDLLSVPLSAFAFGGIVFGLSQIGAAAHGGEAGDNSMLALVIAFVVGAVSLVLFVWRQIILARRDDALLDLRVFRVRNFTLVIVQIAIVSAAFFGAVMVVPLYLQNVLGLGKIESGLVLLPGALAMGLLGPVVGRLYDARGPRLPLVGGAIAVAASLWLYTLINEHTSVWFVLVVQTLLSMGLALSFTPLFTAGLGALPQKLYSHGSAVLGTVQQVAGAAGVALLFTVMTGVGASSAASGASAAAAGGAGAAAAFLLAAVIALPALLIAFLIVKPDEGADESSAAPEETVPAGAH